MKNRNHGLSEKELVQLLMADCESTGDIQAKLKKLFAGTIEQMLEVEMALDEIIWLITLLCNQSIEIYNLRNSDKKPLLTEETVELLTSPRRACRIQGRNHRSYAERHETKCRKRTPSRCGRYLKKRSNSRVNDAELFTRLFYYGTAQRHLGSEEVWLMPFGFLLDLWECHKQFIGISKPKREANIDEVVPMGI